LQVSGNDFLSLAEANASLHIESLKFELP